jgi:ribosomal-protein-serine acetyltransferase
MMEARPISITPWLEARPAVPAFAEALADMIQRNIAHFHRYLPAVAALTSVELVRNHLAGVADRAARNEVLEWYLFADGKMCGGNRLNKIELDNHKVSIAYMLDAAFQGRGIASLAVRAFLEYCFGELGLNRVELTCATSNERSARVAERAGFLREGLLRQAELLDGAFVDHYVYGLLRADFRPREFGEEGSGKRVAGVSASTS